jgi:molybdopterin converting factor subunit 1
MEIEVLFFARTRELAGRSKAALSVRAGATVGDVLRRIEEEFPALEGRLRSCRVAVNEEFASDDTAPVPDRSVLAIIPPVSGG